MLSVRMVRMMLSVRMVRMMVSVRMMVRLSLLGAVQ